MFYILVDLNVWGVRLRRIEGEGEMEGSGRGLGSNSAIVDLFFRVLPACLRKFYVINNTKHLLSGFHDYPLQLLGDSPSARSEEREGEATGRAVANSARILVFLLKFLIP